MFFNPEDYRYSNLKSEDKSIVDAVDRTRDFTMTNKVIKDFISQAELSSTPLTIASQRLLTDFTRYQKERIEYLKSDIIVELIEGSGEASREATTSKEKFKRNKE